MNNIYTEWFDGKKFVPAHVGVYQRDYSDMQNGNYIAYCKWDGEFWMMFANNPYSANDEYKHSVIENSNWRGLANDPTKNQN